MQRRHLVVVHNAVPHVGAEPNGPMLTDKNLPDTQYITTVPVVCCGRGDLQPTSFLGVGRHTPLRWVCMSGKAASAE
jgi:hypothetical protein